MTTATRTETATTAQLSYIQDLLIKRSWSRIATDVETFVSSDSPTKAAASSLIGKLKLQPWSSRPTADNTPTAAPAAARVTEPGMYRAGEAIYKVQKAKQSGNLYAKRLIVTTKVDEETGEVSRHGDFEFESGAIRKITAADRMTVEEAAELGHLYTFCIYCGAELTDTKTKGKDGLTSVERGIGPVCFSRI